MLFTIITVCYNSEGTIERTIKSILNQTIEDYEYLIVDGQSTDHTLSIIRKYEPLFKGRMRWISEKDKGIYDAMNKGISMAKGELIGIVNSDDYYEKDTLENVAESYHGEDYKIIYGILRTLQNNKEKMVYLKSPKFIEEDMIAHPSCFITKKVYDTFGDYSLDYPYSADYEFMLRIKDKKEIQYEPVYHILSNFSLDGASGQIKGYRDTLRLKKEYKLISTGYYRREMIKSWIAMKLKRKK